MDNIVIEKIWNDSDIISNGLFEVKMTCTNNKNEFTNNYYFCTTTTKKIEKKIDNFLKKHKMQEISFRTKTKKRIPSFSLKFIDLDYDNNIIILVTMENAISDRVHYYELENRIITIKTTRQQLELFKGKIAKLIDLEINQKITLN